MAALVSCLLPAGCADASQLAPGTTAAPDAAVDTTQDLTLGVTDSAADGDPPLVDEPGDGRWLWVFPDPPTHDHDGIRLSVTGMGITDATRADAVPTDIARFLDEEVSTVVVLEIEVENVSDVAASVFPSLARLHVGDEHTTAKALLSDTIGRELAPGDVDAGVVLWTLHRSFEDVLADGELVLDASEPIDAATRDRIGGPIELLVAWEPPADAS